MKTEIHFVDGETSVFEEESAVRLTDLGVEVTEYEGDDLVRILFPWSRVEKLKQRGAEIGSAYTF